MRAHRPRRLARPRPLAAHAGSRRLADRGSSVNVLRIATYNLHKGRGLDGRVNVARIADVIAEIDADVVALQEVATPGDDPQAFDQLRYFAERLGYHAAFGRARSGRGCVYGNATLSRRPFASVSPLNITVPRRTGRGALRTDLALDAGVLHVFNVHLGLGYLERRDQANRLFEDDALKAPDLSGARIVLGDFNEWVKGQVTKSLRREFGLTDLEAHVPRLRAFPHGLPLLHLDHIYYDHHLRVQAARTHRSRLALIASDHLPLVADFVFEGDAGV
ncbi:MAG: endonuclease/exonuclease/phosphatase family protein [Gammaproteobacteria bacterium]|nr:endonuclease/exonuclease/phosphatase family protein [Gammaproteobacteria bacterium]